MSFVLRNIKINAATHATHHVNLIKNDELKHDDSMPKLNSNIIPNDKFLDTNGLVYPSNTHICCWHCKHPFTSLPFGIPLQVYNNNNLLENSHIKQIYDKVKVDQSTPLNYHAENNMVLNRQCNKCSNMFQTRNNTINTCINCSDDNYIFIMEGFFCSFECQLAYITEYKHLEIYKNSEKYLNFLYFRCFNKIMDIKPAKDWRSLPNFSGDISMNIVHFRENNTSMVKLPYIYLTPCGVFNQQFK